METQYEIIAGVLLAACPPEVDRAWVQAKVDEGHVRAEYWYQRDGATAQPKIESAESFRIARALLDLREAWPGGKFSVANFAVAENGEFKFDVGYDD